MPLCIHPQPDVGLTKTLWTPRHPQLQVDPELHRHIVAETGDGAVWGMSWFLTWLSHTTPGLAQAARLFDLFMASHPLMPLYVGAVAVEARSHWGLTSDYYY
jgi:hypothetical protein